MRAQSRGKKGTIDLREGGEMAQSTFLTEQRTGEAGTKGRFEQLQGELSKVMEGLNGKIARILSKQEGEYINSFKYFVGKKEEEIKLLHDRIQKDEEEGKRNEDKHVRDLAQALDAKQQEVAYLADLCQAEKKETLKWKAKTLNLADDCTFLDKKLRSAMKEVQMLRYFVLQIELFLSEQVASPADTQPCNQTQVEEPSDSALISRLRRLLVGIRQFNSVGDIDPVNGSFEVLGDFLGAQGQLPPKRLPRRSHSIHAQQQPKLAETKTLNRKEETTAEQKQLVQDAEKKYKETLAQYKKAIERMEKEVKILKHELVSEKLRKNDLERIFMDCVQEGRRQLYKRKLKTMQSAQKVSSVKPGSDSEQDISQVELIYKLAALQDRKVKYDDFTAADKQHILSLFVSNEEVVQKIYEHMFPHRVSEFNRLKGEEAANSPSDVEAGFADLFNPERYLQSKRASLLEVCAEPSPPPQGLQPLQDNNLQSIGQKPDEFPHLPLPLPTQAETKSQAQTQMALSLSLHNPRKTFESPPGLPEIRPTSIREALSINPKRLTAKGSKATNKSHY